MKLACAVGGFGIESLTDYLHFLGSIGIRYAEIGYGGSFHSMDWEQPVAALCKEIHRVEAESGVQVVALSVIPELSVHTGEEFSARVEMLKKATAVAGILQIPVVKVLAGASRSESMTAGQISEVVRGLKTVEAEAKRNRVQVGIENFDPLTTTSDGIRSLLSPLDGNVFGVVYDPGNIAVMNEDPMHFIEEMSDHIVLVHLKDIRSNGNGGFDECAVGDGVMDWTSLLRQLSDVYDGYYAVEYPYAEGIQQITRQSVEYMQNLGGWA